MKYGTDRQQSAGSCERKWIYGDFTGDIIAAYIGEIMRFAVIHHTHCSARCTLLHVCIALHLAVQCTAQHCTDKPIQTCMT